MSLEMARSRFSYHRLKNTGVIGAEEQEQEREVIKIGSWWRLRRVSSRRRQRLRIPGLKRFLRRKSRLLSASWFKLWKRLKESRSHFGDLFVGNYMFMQVSPSPLGCLEKSFMGHDNHGMYSLKRVV